jgi:3-phosphoshikimate 1-carboxyvinyltransferase
MKTLKKITPVSRVKARIRLPGSKSVTHRAFLMAALADGESEIRNPLSAEDTLLTAEALRKLGVHLTWEGEVVRIAPPKKRWSQPEGPIMLGNSGTSMRLLPALASIGSGKFIFDGTQRIRERPIGPVLEALKNLGPQCRYLLKEGFPPIEIRTSGLSGGEVWVNASQSSQFLSALLIASPCAKKEMRVGWKEPVASFPYVELTLSMMEQSGIEYRWIDRNQIAVPAPQLYCPLQYLVEGDCSSASYFWAAAALKQGEVFTHPVLPGSIQGDCRLLEVLERMGCEIQWEEEGVRVIGPESLKPFDLDMNKIPDMVPTMAVLAAFATGRSHIRNVRHLRVKESDRLSVVVQELTKFGIPVKELPDGLVIDGGSVHPPDAPIEAHDDHRIAMAFALMGLCVEGVEIHGAEAVAKSFPSFWEEFKQFSDENAATCNGS